MSKWAEIITRVLSERCPVFAVINGRQLSITGLLEDSDSSPDLTDRPPERVCCFPRDRLQGNIPPRARAVWPKCRVDTGQEAWERNE